VEEHEPLGNLEYLVEHVAGPVGLDANVESLVVVNTEERDIDTIDASGKRVKIKQHYYFVSIILDGSGYESLKPLESAAGDPGHEMRRGVRILVNGTSQAQRFWLDHKNKHAYLRLVLHEDQLDPLLKAVKKPWKDDPEGTSTVNDWTAGKGIPDTATLVQ
jgi:hypothetical protein